MMLSMTVPPGPIFFLLVGRKMAKIPMRVTVRLYRPLVVVCDFIMVPHMVVAVIWIVDSIVVMSTSSS